MFKINNLAAVAAKMVDRRHNSVVTKANGRWREKDDRTVCCS
jgi:hypothetical protein